MAKERRMPFEEFAANLREVIDRVVHRGKTVGVKTSGNVNVVVRAVFGSRAAEGRERTKPAREHDAFLASAGSWSDAETDRLIAFIYARRIASCRPKVEL